MSYFGQRIRSFKYAFNGIAILFKTQPNAVIHLLVALVVILAGFYFAISIVEWLLISFAIGLVLVVEAVNSSLEFLADTITRNQNEWIKKAKDLAAGAVLLASLTALTIGLIIFIPKLSLIQFQ